MNTIASIVRAAVVLSVLVVVVSAARAEEKPPLPARNLLPNSSFEKEADNDVQGWDVNAWEGEAGVRWSVGLSGHSGNQSVSIRSEQGADAAWTTMVSVKPDAWYRLAGWIKTNGVQGARGALLNVQDLIGVETKAITGTTNWTPVEVRFHVGDLKEIQINCLFGGWGKSVGQAWFDDVSLVEFDPAKEPAQDLVASVIIDTEVPAKVYDPMIFGGFLEHFHKQVYGGVFDPGSPLADAQGFRTDVVAALRELKIPVVRWPGGIFVDDYDWQTGVGPNRRGYLDKAWGVREPNTFGTHEFVELCQRIGAAPYIATNGKGPIQDMTNWVEYTNATSGAYADQRQVNGASEPLAVPFWSVGNENYAAAYAVKVRDSAMGMKAVDPSIQITAPAENRTIATLLATAGQYLDLISIHDYPIDNFQNFHRPTFLQAISKSEDPERIIGDAVAQIERAGYRGQIKIAFDEWNLRSWHHPGFPWGKPDSRAQIAARDLSFDPSLYTMADALFAASFLNSCLRHADDVAMANVAPIVNQSGPLYVHPKGIIKRTHFHTMAMYTRHLKGKVVEARINAPQLSGTSVSQVDAIVTTDDNRSYTIAIMNRNPALPVDCRIVVPEHELSGAFSATVLTGESPDAYNDIDHPDRVAPETVQLQFEDGVVTLPPHSLIIVEVEEDEIESVQETTTTVTIDTAAPGEPYSPMIFGGFLEHFGRQIYGGVFEPGSPLSDEKGFRTDVIAAMKELKVPVVRWPGGCFASGYHWRDGVGPDRKLVPDPVWGVTDPNTFGTAEFVEWCRLIGAEPYICTNAGNGTPEEMMEWVAYCNATEGEWAELRKDHGYPEALDVRFWSIGNENWGVQEIGASTPEKWGPLVDRSAQLMLSVDPDLELAAAATANRDWTLPLLKASGRHLDYVAVHKYWLGYWRKNDMPEYLSCIMHADSPQHDIAQVIEVLEESGHRGRIKIAFDEWNLRGWHHPGFPRKQPVAEGDTKAGALVAKRAINDIGKQYTMADALFTAAFLNACLRNHRDVGMANIAPILNTRGPLFVHPEGIVKRSTFHVLAMYANLLQDRVVPVSIETGRVNHAGRSIAHVDAIATADEAGKTYSLALSNRHPTAAATCTVRMNGKVLEGAFDAVLLTADSPEAFNDVDSPDRVKPVKQSVKFSDGKAKVPPHSLLIFSLESQG